MRSRIGAEEVLIAADRGLTKACPCASRFSTGGSSVAGGRTPAPPSAVMKIALRL
jgi:hypothetical protein